MQTPTHWNGVCIPAAGTQGGFKRCDTSSSLTSGRFAGILGWTRTRS